MNIKHFTLKIMDYKEKYEKALEKAKEYKNVYKDHTMMSYAKGALEDIFPELKESEDDKIRKGLVRLLKELLELGGVSEDEWNRNECEKYIAWLEKQGEQKPVWSEEDEKMFLETMRDIDAVEKEWGCVCDSEMKWLESIKQKLKG